MTGGARGVKVQPTERHPMITIDQLKAEIDTLKADEQAVQDLKTILLLIPTRAQSNENLVAFMEYLGVTEIEAPKATQRQEDLAAKYAVLLPELEAFKTRVLAIFPESAISAE